MSGTAKLGAFLREVSNWTWEEFVRAEHDKTYSSNEALIFALVRSCAMEQLPAIKTALNRLDGKLKTPVKIEYPKVYYLYPNAEAAAEPSRLEGAAPLDTPPQTDSDLIAAPELPEPEVELNDLPSLSLRETLTKMSDYPRELPENIVTVAQQIEQSVKGQGLMPADNPLVKSVVAAHLLMLAHNRDIGALTEVFDQIDGKLAETIQILGEDIYITSYATVAPEGAYQNDQGVLQLEAAQVQDLWAKKLGKEIIDVNTN